VKVDDVGDGMLRLELPRGEAFAVGCDELHRAIRDALGGRVVVFPRERKEYETGLEEHHEQLECGGGDEQNEEGGNHSAGD
jgi:hypothetical protein